MLGCESVATALASRSKRARRPGLVCEEVGQDFDRDVTIQLRVARPIDLAHAACADLGEDVVATEARAGSEGQSVVDYTGGTGSANGTAPTLRRRDFRPARSRIERPFATRQD